MEDDKKPSERFEELEALKLEDEKQSLRHSIESKKISIAQAKRELGPDWKQTLRDAGVGLWKYITSPETRQSLKTMAGSGSELRDLTKLRRLR